MRVPSPDGKSLVTGAVEHSVAPWDADSGTRLATLAGHNATVDAVAFSPDGGRLASAGADGVIELWDTDPEHTVTTIWSTLDRILTRAEWDQYAPGTAYHQTCGPGADTPGAQG